MKKKTKEYFEDLTRKNNNKVKVKIRVAKSNGEVRVVSNLIAPDDLVEMIYARCGSSSVELELVHGYRSEKRVL